MAAVAEIGTVVLGNPTVLKRLRDLKIGKPPAGEDDTEGWIYFKH